MKKILTIRKALEAQADYFVKRIEESTPRVCVGKDDEPGEYYQCLGVQMGLKMAQKIIKNKKT